MLLQSLLKALELRQNQIEALTEVAKVNPNGANEAGLGEPMRTATGMPSLQPVYCRAAPWLPGSLYLGICLGCLDESHKMCWHHAAT